MKISSLTVKRIVVWALVIGLLATMGLAAAAGTAIAAPKYTLTGVASTQVQQTGQKLTITVTYKKGTKARAKASVQLQYYNAAKKKWVNEGKAKKTSSAGKATFTVKQQTAGKKLKYRFYVKASKTQKKFTVHWVPGSFTIKGSGFGPGVGMPQYGALQYLKEQPAKTYADALAYYYKGAKLESVNRNGRTVKVQVLTPRTTTTVTGGGFTVTDENGSTLGSFPAGSIALGVRGSKVTVGGTDSAGAAVSASASRVTIRWNNDTTTASVAGAEGVYKYGNLQATVINGGVNVVNEVLMNSEYLYGIEEMPASWGTTGYGKQALKAQAVASRSFTIAKVSRANGYPGGVDAACDCQLRASTADQNFIGWQKKLKDGAHYQQWIDAVDGTMTATTVEVLRSSNPGQIVEAMFYSATGKVANAATGSSADVVGTAQNLHPNLVSVVDPYSAKAAPSGVNAWPAGRGSGPRQVVLSQAQLQSLFGLKSSEKVVSVSIGRYPGGLIKSLTATLHNGRKTSVITKPAQHWMAALGTPSPWVTSISGK